MNTRPGTDNLQPATPKRFTCRHIFHGGHRCGSPALRGDRIFCFYHRSTPRPDPPLPSTDPEVKFAGPFFAELLLPLPEDRAAIQTGIGIVMRAIGSAKIDIRRANGLLSALKLAAQNLPPHPKECVDRSSSSVSRSSNSEQRTTKNEDRPKSAEIVDEIELSPDLGPLAPVLEYGLPESESEEEREPSLAQIIDAWIKSPPDPEPVPLEKRPYDFDTLQLLRRTLATTTNPETAARIRKALEEEALLPNHNLHIQACAETRVPQVRRSHRRPWGYSLLHPATTDTPCPANDTTTSARRRPKTRRLPHLFSKTCKKNPRATPPQKGSRSNCRLTALQARSSPIGPYNPELPANRRLPRSSTLLRPALPDPQPATSNRQL
jgi:hypothetical protein